MYFKNQHEQIKDIDKSKILLFVSGILNSKLYQQYYSGNNNTGTKIKSLDIVKINFQEKEQNQFFESISELVEHGLSIAKNYDNGRNMDKQTDIVETQNNIDNLVYRLYGLSKGDIRIVEESVR